MRRNNRGVVGVPSKEIRANSALQFPNENPIQGCDACMAHSELKRFYASLWANEFCTGVCFTKFVPQLTHICLLNGAG